MNKKEQQIISGIYTRIDDLEDRLKVVENKYKAQTKVVLHLMNDNECIHKWKYTQSQYLSLKQCDKCKRIESFNPIEEFPKDKE